MPTPTQSGYVVKLVAVAGGNVYVTAAGDTTWTTAADGPGVSSPPLNSSGLVFSAANGTGLFFADGANWRYLDLDDTTVKVWAATAGALPVDDQSTLPRLICTWRGRTVLAGLLNDPTNWFMSAQLDPFDYDYSPEFLTPTMAVAGNSGASTATGQPNDAINSLCPYSDDTLVVFCDHSTYVMRGDPAAGGQLDLVSDAIGSVWGQQAWAKDPGGTVWFMSNRAAVYSMTPGSAPVRRSAPVDKFLSGLDLGVTTVRLLWDDTEQGLHVFLTPLDAPAATTHLFWEGRTGAWWFDRFADTGHDPLCCLTFDGPLATDRVALVGCWDGYVRAISRTATTDDGTAIASYVWLGPVLTKSMDDVMFSEVQAALGANSGSVTWAAHVGGTPEEALASTLVADGTFAAGRSYTFPVRRSGHALYLKLSATSQWAFEQCRAVVRQLGKVRRRDK